MLPVGRGIGIGFDTRRGRGAAPYIALDRVDLRQTGGGSGDEEGTEAAAVTVVEGGVLSFDGPFEFRADRLFLFVIRERASGTILFAGIFAEPPDAG